MIDVLIIGSGPAGLSAAIYARRANLNVTVLEKLYMGLGQVAESRQVDNYLGMPGMNGYDMGEAFRRHAEDFGAEFLEGEAAEIKKEGDIFCIVLKDGERLSARTVIYAAGAAHRHLGVVGEDVLAGRGVSYCAVCDGAFYRKKIVAVAGGGDTALDDALYLSEMCSKVYLIHRREEFRGAKATLLKLREKENVTILAPAVINEVKGENKVSGIVLSDGSEIECQGLFVAVGMEPQTELLKGFVTLDKTGYVVADETGKTSVDGFFVAGDVRAKALRQVVTAAADGANAAVFAAEYLRGLAL
ncbi:MAG: FAD-dependent oxidoreductase [Lachnospiraceae bacterium]|nr:FAD-dependent oxidoreductase [Lachnospiraceae bacterium]